MRKGFLKLTAVVVAVLFGAALLAACAQTTEQVEKHPRTAGGVGGAVLGGAIGGGKGALIGGLLGALGGGVIGNYTEKQSATREQTLQETGTAPGQSTLNIQKLNVAPTTVVPGGQVDIGMTYALVTPQPGETATVRETREIKLNNQVVGQMSVDRAHTSGTWQSSVPVTLPQSATPGDYTVVAAVVSGGKTDSRTTTFTVR